MSSRVRNAALVDGLKGLMNPTGPVSEQFKEGMLASNILRISRGVHDAIDAQHHHGRAVRYVSDEPAGRHHERRDHAGRRHGHGCGIRGEVFTIAGVFSVNPETKQSTGQLLQFTVTSNYAGGAATSRFRPPCTSPVRARTSRRRVRIFRTTRFDVPRLASTTYAQNIAYHRDALTMVTPPTL